MARDAALGPVGPAFQSSEVEMKFDDATKETAIRRYRTIAAGEAMIALAMLLVYFTVPLWADGANARTFAALFLAAAGIFAALAGAMMWAASLMKRDLY